MTSAPSTTPNRLSSPLVGFLVCALCTGLAAAAAANDDAQLFEAARTGDLAQVRQLLDSGVAVDATDRYEATALFKAAKTGQLDVVELLLERGASAQVQESFWGQTAVAAAAQEGHLEVVARLLGAGAEGREFAFQIAMQNAAARPEASLALARAAMESGPFLESAIDRLRNAAPPKAYRALLEEIEVVADPPPPKLTAADLEPFLGRYEGWADDTMVVAEAKGDQLTLRIDDGNQIPLVAIAENVFRSVDGKLDVNYFGRFGSIEGIFLSGSRQAAVRRSVAEPVTASDISPTADASITRPDEPVRQTTVWPSFRGPNGDGIGDGAAVPTQWDLEDGDNLRWSVALPGLGNSSPVIWGDLVIVTTAIAEGVEQKVTTGDTGSGADVDESVEHSWQVLAFDRTTGAQRWATEVGRGVPLTRRHFKASQANSTPVTNGKTIVAVFPTAGMAALDFDGKVLWQEDLGGLNSSNFFDPDDQWGFASSPILYGDTVLLQVDVFGGGYLGAWDLATGEQRWRTEREDASSWSTPTIFSTDTGDELVVNASTIRGYDPNTGERLWSLGPNSELVIARPVVGDGVVYVSAGYAPVKPVYAIRSGLRGDLEVKPGDEHGALLWSHRVGGAYMPSPLLYRGLLYVVHHNGRIVAYDAASGAARYKKRFSRGGTFTGSPVVNNGHLFVPTEGGLLYVLRAGGAYEEVAVHDFDEPLMATPAIADGVLYVRTPSTLFAIGETTAGSVTEATPPAAGD